MVGGEEKGEVDELTSSDGSDGGVLQGLAAGQRGGIFIPFRAAVAVGG